MDFASLKQFVQHALETSPFEISGSELISPAVTAMLSRSFGTDKFSLTGAKISGQTNSSITVQGAVLESYSGFSGLQGEVVFTAAEEAVQVVIRLSGFQPGWKLSDLYPQLAGGVFDLFNYSGPVIQLDSMGGAAFPDSYPEVYGYVPSSDTMKKGLAQSIGFEAALTLAKKVSGLEWLIAAESWELSGQIANFQGQTAAVLASVPQKPLEIAGFKLPFKLNLVSVILEPVSPGDPYTTACMLQLEADIERDIGRAQPLVIPVYIREYSGRMNIVAVESRLSGPTSIRLSELASLIGSGSLDTQVPGLLPALDDIQLEQVALTLSAASCELLSASATISYRNDKGWTVLDNILVFKGMQVTFDYAPGQEMALETTVACTAVLSGGTLDASILLPELIFTCELTEGVIDIGSMIEHAAGDLKWLPQIQCSDLKIFGNIKEGSYRFQATVDSGWSFQLGQKELVFTEISLDISKTSQAVSGEITGKFTVAELPLYVMAEYETGAGATLTGGIGGRAIGQGLSLTKLTGEILSLFSVSLPAHAPELTLTGLNLSFNTKTHDFSFMCSSGLTLAEIHFDLVVEVSVVHQNDNPDVTFKGYFWVEDSQFELDFMSTEMSKVIQASWSLTKKPHDDAEGDQVKPLGLDTLARAFGLDAELIPEGLDLALTHASFRYDLSSGDLVLTAESAHYGNAVFISKRISDTSSIQGFQDGQKEQNGQNEQDEQDKQDELNPLNGLNSPGMIRVFAFGLDIPTAIRLADLPLVGSKLPDAEQLQIRDFGFWYVSHAVSKQVVEQLNGLVTQGGATGLPKLQDAELSAPICLQATLQLGEDSTLLQLPLGGQSVKKPKPVSHTQPLAADIPGASLSKTSNYPAPAKTRDTLAPAVDPTSWFSIQRTFGIFTFKRIGVRYEGGSLTFALDASIALGPLSFSLDGLSISSPLTRFAPVFGLSGLGLEYNQAPIEISGALMRVPGSQLSEEVKFMFNGTAVVKAEEFALAAIGSYAQMTSGDPSLFIFAELDAPLGGPPALFVTGLMGGFGFNRMLEAPAQDEVLGFPLLALTEPSQPGRGDSPRDPMHILDVLQGNAPIVPNGEKKAWIAPKPGEYWLAVGVQFTSFELVRTKALLIVDFGRELQFLLLGLSSMQLPQPEVSSQTYVNLELQLRAVLQPNEGFFGLSAVLGSSSYVLSRDCHLTGGFAFYFWFGDNDHAGQFVLTLGGYHPAFKPPEFYPQEPRIGINWAVSDKVSIKGGAYFALTPSCVMTGGGLEATFHDGDLQAWFTAHADLLVNWHPFSFLAHIDVGIGVSYRLNLLFCHKTISISLGATVDMWGPPTGGEVHVNLSVVSFTVHFGSSGADQRQDPLLWDEFTKLLPKPEDICKITVANGLFKTLENDGEESGQTWVVRAGKFRFFTQSAIPASELRTGKTRVETTVETLHHAELDNRVIDQPTISIRPMDLTEISSVHTLNVTHVDSGALMDTSAWSLVPRYQNVPESLWAVPPEPFTQVPGRPEAKVLKDQLVGYDVQPPISQLGFTRGAANLEVLGGEQVAAGGYPLSPNAVEAGTYNPAAAEDTVAQVAALMKDEVVLSRNALLQALRSSGLYNGPSGPLDRYAAEAAHSFSDPPMRQS
ncbi:DUF6603 domain-containing protein [Paenibacillus sp. J22TS3]|uniref:DUF6603 domain-containing protein n=1 Tax=Paenibacillus sp. J22TS3 TaxID=2807192 RepID=UPI001B284F52|nr:DUF6603 domain-containing protein [Paenibacillus sp. J22TS3]GIP23382.1 hypothetical protein J22TS3_36570 [Paenibacillus sp. J22TS3]